MGLARHHHYATCMQRYSAALFMNIRADNVCWRDADQIYDTDMAWHMLKGHLGQKLFTYMLSAWHAGKTTLLRMIAGLESTTSGRILFDGEAIHAHAASCCLPGVIAEIVLINLQQLWR